MVNEYHARSFNWATDEQLTRMKELSFKVNSILKELFLKGNLLLVDSSWSLAYLKAKWCLGMSSLQTVAACGTSILAKSWTRTASAKAWAVWLKPTKKSRIALARFNRQKPIQLGFFCLLAAKPWHCD